jgi:hypothetical protein
MGPTTFSTTEAPEIRILSIGGDLRVTGWDLNQCQAESDRPSDLTCEQTAEGGRLACRSDMAVSVPRRARVIIENVRGDAKAKALEGALEIESVGGSLTLRHTGAVSAAQVNGDIDAKQISGPLKVKVASGWANARGVSGDLEIDVRGDLNVSQAGGSIRARAGGDMDLRRCLAAGVEYTLEAGGDIRLRVDPGLWARFEMQAGGEVITRGREAQAEGNAKYQVMTLGSEEAGGVQAQVRARAGNDVILGWEPASAEMEDLGEDISKMANEYAAQIESQAHSHMAELERMLAERLAKVNVPPGTVEVRGAEVAAHVRQAMEHASDKARRKAEAWQRKMERQAPRSRPDWGSRGEAPGRERGAAPPPPPVEPVSEAERLMILRMLAEGKITVDQAEKLLAALEGRA